MVPSYYVKLQHIPLTSNGKVDRKSLPDPEGTGLKQGEYVAPSTDTEKHLVKLWSEVLGVEEGTLSIKADFFDLGGNSLNAIRLITRIQRSLEVRLMISDLFLNPELELMARLIESLNGSNEVKSNFEIEL
jgi:acyl carrier protein